MIHLFCALPCEAKPLLDHFQLKADQSSDLFKIYLSEDNAISLTITGVGKLNAASAVAYHVAHITPLTSDIWLNIGIAGHQNADIGTAYLANKIVDEITQASWYPQFIFTLPCESLPLVTLESPSSNYDANLFDMEASGFYSVANRIGTNELTHCFKIISDNASNDFQNLNAKQVTQYIEQHVSTIETIIHALMPFSEELKNISAPPDAFNELIDQFHFTATEKVQLQQLLKQWKLRVPDMDPADIIQMDMQAKAILKALSNKLETSPFSFSTRS